MTREEKLYSMRMQDLVKIADKLGIKINTKAAKSKAIETILAAEEMNKQNENELKKEEAATVKIEEPKLVPMPGTEDPNWGKKHYTSKSKKGELIEYNGKAQTLTQWAKELNKPAQTLYYRIKMKGWDIEKAFTK